jgi:[acyl-carrier-protein] S-malonyltransferase
MTTAFVFPGQGSQSLGMGRDLANNFATAKHIFEEVNDALSQNLTSIMWGDDSDALNLTENTQPALMAVSVAVTRVLEEQGGFTLADKGAYVAGHSLGEYSALTAANAFTVPDTARLLKLRGQAMQRAVPVGQGAMAAILGLSFDDVMAIADEATSPDSICQLANDNSDGQVVVSGHKQAVEKACALASDKGAKRAILLPVSAPFHCALMQPAAIEMKDALSSATIQSPSIPVIANVTAQVETDPDTIRNLLVDQITGRVRWRESVEWMGNNDVTQMIELGAGKVLCGLARRINKDITSANAETPEQIEKLLEILG